jgi:hypothetical protein
MNGPTPGVVVRWTSRRRPAAGGACDECGTVAAEPSCPTCGQLTGELVAMLATVVDTPAGVRLVIAEHRAGGWVPIRTLPATTANVTALSRPGATGPAVVASGPVGGLW